VVPALAHRDRSSHERSPLNERPSSRANPARVGDAKPGIFPAKTARLPEALVVTRTIEVKNVKANLARFTAAVALLATIAMTLEAGLKWR
jgi:hypothetical protein